MNCIICGKIIKGYGNNALPLKKGTCCDSCNINKVIPFRLKKINERRDGNDGKRNNSI